MKSTDVSKVFHVANKVPLGVYQLIDGFLTFLFGVIDTVDDVLWN